MSEHPYFAATQHLTASSTTALMRLLLQMKLVEIIIFTTIQTINSHYEIMKNSNNFNNQLVIELVDGSTEWQAAARRQVRLKTGNNSAR